MADIKLKDVSKGTVKVSNKIVAGSEHIKQAYIKTKDKAESSMDGNSNTIDKYATDKIENTSSDVAHKATQHASKIGRKSVYETKLNFHKVNNGIDNLKKKYAEKKLTKQANNSPLKQSIKTIERNEKAIKQSATSAGNKSIKLATNELSNISRRSVKTAEQTAKMSIKTTKQATQKVAKTTQKTAKITKETTKATVKTTVATVKALISGTKALITAIIAGGWIAILIILIVVLLGSAIAIFGGSDNTYTSSVSPEVEAYEPLIQKYAKEYGISEYVELIKAVMMQESGGKGLDPMQSSEGAFNTKYPKKPNGIQNPEYSIQCGVQELKSVLNSAEVKSPIDMEHIKLALQGYNFGNGYISWAKANYGGYSYANAVEFANIQAKKLGWSSYGDTQYVTHVLRYYPYGQAFATGDNQAIVKIAKSQIGNKGGQPYWSWYGFNNRVEWCACFVSWCANECGYIDSGLVPKFAMCDDGVNWFKSKGRWKNRSYEPKPGDIIFFDWDNDGSTDHVGIVEKAEQGKIYTIEGNSHDTCKQNQYSVSDKEIFGCGTLINQR